MEEQTRQTETEHKSLIDTILNDALDVGSAWAAHGLRAGRSALETTAMTLSKTAQTLERVANEVAAARAKPVEVDGVIPENPAAPKSEPPPAA
jgi:hypothetical protein